jgi:hypothetical protein
MKLVTDGTGDGGTELGSRFFSSRDHLNPSVALFVQELMAQAGLDSGAGDAFATASIHAFSLFTRLGMDHKEICVTGRAAEGYFILEMTNGLDFRQALRDAGGRLKTTNYDLLCLIAALDEVHVGHTDDGRSIVRLAVRLVDQEAAALLPASTALEAGGGDPQG